MNEDLVKGDIVFIRRYGVSGTYNDYMFRLLEAATDGEPLDAIPGVVSGNIVNQTNPENYALGCVRLSEVSSAKYMVQ